MKEEVEKLRKEYSDNTLAMDLLKELKMQNKRQHITIIILIGVIIAMFIGFFIFIKQYEVVGEESTEQLIQDISDSSNTTYTQQID